MNVNLQKVRRQVITSWCHTTVSMIVLGLLVVIGGTIAADTFGSSSAFFEFLLSAFGLAFFAFLLAEVVIVTIMNGHRATRDEYPQFIEVVDELLPGKRLFRPRLYILEIPVPNAAAFGWGILGQSAIGISPELYRLLDKSELKAVIAHELGHIRMKDVGVMSVVSMALSALDRFAKSAGQNNAVMSIPGIGVFVPIIAFAFRQWVLPMIRSSISQEREYCADALAAQWCGSPDPLISGLRKLEQWISNEKANRDKEKELHQRLFGKKSPKDETEKPRKRSLYQKLRDAMKEEQNEDSSDPSPLDDLFISHPRMTNRIEALERLRS